jgi:GDPmannose 4,6-dehydratase
VDLLRGDASKAKRQLGWEQSHTFEELVAEMVESDLESAMRNSDAAASIAGVTAAP